MPIYAVIFKSKKSGAIADNWDTARMLRDSTPNSYAKKFRTKSEAENYIKELSFKISGNNNSKGIKRKLIELPLLRPPDSLINEHITKAKTAFNDLHLLVTSIPDIPPAHKRQLKVLIEEVFDKVDALLNVDKSNEIKPLDVITTNCADVKDCSTTSINVGDLNPNDANLKKSDIARGIAMFKLNEENEVIVYTDGACPSNGRKEAAAGVGVWFGPDNPLNLSEKLPGLQTNNHAEIYCVVRALERLKVTGCKRVNIHTDSEYAMNCVTKWMFNWKRNSWLTAAQRPVTHKIILIRLQNLIDNMEKVSWTHVRSHTGVKGNEEADRLAKQGALLE